MKFSLNERKDSYKYNSACSSHCGKAVLVLTEVKNFSFPMPIMQ